MSYIKFQDERTEQEKLATTGFITYYSDFGGLRTKGARPIKEVDEYEVISEVMKNRDDLKRVDYAYGKATEEGRIYKPRVKDRQRVFIHNFNSFLPPPATSGLIEDWVTFSPMRGTVEASTELSHGVRVVTTSCAWDKSTRKALLLNEWRVSDLLPHQDLHIRHNPSWQAWVVDEGKIQQALDLLSIVVTSELDKIIQEITIPNTSEYHPEALRLWREIAENRTDKDLSLAYINAKVLGQRNTEHTYMKSLRGWHELITS
ncbi:hypothetical protein F4Z99_17405 [Candidatus Poribacteria bacterium]|nr:hypothetical protein [Candidatus Poribacteria bacterium]